jgi:gas vesicle protein
MDGQTQQDHDHRFLAGLAIGSVVGAGLAMWLAPRAAAEIKARAVGSVRDLGQAASGRYREAKTRVTDAVDGLARRGQGVRDGVCDTVVRGAQTVERGAQHVEHGAQGVERGAQEVERFATDAKTARAV